jgi:hypothetical protein
MNQMRSGMERCFGDELHRAGTDVADRARHRTGTAAKFGAQLHGHAGRGAFLHQLLVPALEGAVALVQVQDVALRVGQHLHLDVPRRGDGAFQQDAVVAEDGGLAPGGGQRTGKAFRCGDEAHAPAAAAADRLDHHGKAQPCRGGRQRRLRLVRPGVARQAGHARGLGDEARRCLAAHGVDGAGRGADEAEARRRAALGELRVLRQEAVAGMNGAGAGAPGGLDDRGDAQVAFARRRGADPLGAVRRRHVHSPRIGVGEDGDARNAQPPAGAGDPHGDLAAIGDQDRPHRPQPRSVAMAWPSSTCSPSCTSTSATVPACGATTGISIFMDSRITTGSSSATAVPAGATIFQTAAPISARMVAMPSAMAASVPSRDLGSAAHL